MGEGTGAFRLIVEEHVTIEIINTMPWERCIGPITSLIELIKNGQWSRGHVYSIKAKLFPKIIPDGRNELLRRIAVAITAVFIDERKTKEKGNRWQRKTSSSWRILRMTTYIYASD